MTLGKVDFESLFDVKNRRQSDVLIPISRMFVRSLINFLKS